MALGPRDLIDPNKFFPNPLRFMENSILQFLQILFTTFPQNIPGSYFYDPSDDLTTIKIEGQNTDNLQSVDTRPKIVVARGPVQWNMSGINNFVGAADLSSFRHRHAAILKGTVGINCFSRNDLEADNIANICSSSVEKFSPIIRRYGYLSIHAAQVGQRALIMKDARPDLFITPVMVRTEVTSNWSRSKVDPVLLRKLLISYTLTTG